MLQTSLEIDINKINKNNIFLELEKEISRVIIGNNEVIRSIIIGILCQSHILVEGPPGVAKTTLIKSFAQAMGLSFKRIQFTPDLLPSDIIGTVIFNSKKNDFEVRKGPLFANIILADEINRTPAKVQAALLEAMQEKQITIGMETFKLDEPFIVFATQNPLEHEGTYQLPEAQIDRFMMKLYLGYPTQNEEIEIIKKAKENQILNQIIDKNILLEASEIVKQVFVSEQIINYIATIVQATRKPLDFGLTKIAEYIDYGASPRASLALYNAAQALAFLESRSFVVPDDIKKIAPFIIGHRIGIKYNFDQQINGLELVRKIIANIKTP